MKLISVVGLQTRGDAFSPPQLGSPAACGASAQRQTPRQERSCTAQEAQKHEVRKQIHPSSMEPMQQAHWLCAQVAQTQRQRKQMRPTGMRRPQQQMMHRKMQRQQQQQRQQRMRCLQRP